jgi:hypothetical protein
MALRGRKICKIKKDTDGVWTWEAKNSQGESQDLHFRMTKAGISSAIEAWLLKN